MEASVLKLLTPIISRLGVAFDRKTAAFPFLNKTRFGSKNFPQIFSIREKKTVVFSGDNLPD